MTEEKRADAIKRALERETAFFLVSENACPEKIEIRITYPSSMAILRIDGAEFKKIFGEGR